MPRSPEPPHTRDRGFSRTAMVGVLASLMIVAGVVILAINAASSPSSDTDPIDDAQLEPNAIPDAPPANPTGRTIGQEFGPADAARITLVDRSDPTRIAWDIEVDRFDPVPNTQLVRVAKPRGWVYLDPDSPTYFSADHATFAIEQFGQEPDTGRFEGNVDIRVFPLTDQNPSDTDPDARLDTLLRIRTEALDFDTLRGQLATDVPIAIDATTVQARLPNLSMLIEPERQRVERITSDGPGSLRVLPRETAVAFHTPRRARTADQSRSPHIARVAWPNALSKIRSNARPQTAVEEEPAETFYDGSVTGNVQLVRDTQQIEGPVLNFFARLIENALPDDAIREIASIDQHPRPLGAVLAWAPIAAQPAAPPHNPTENAPENPTESQIENQTDDADPVVLTWEDTLRIDRVEDEPTPLASDDLVATFRASDDEPVTLTDTAADISGTTTTATYALTRGLIALRGNESHPIRIDADRSGTLHATELDLLLETGVGVIRGPGILETTATPRRAITWVERVDFLLTPAGGSRAIQSATFAGGVRLTDPRLTATGDNLLTRFSNDPNAPAAGLSLAKLVGGASARAATGQLDADDIEIRFATDPNATTDADPTPRRVTAQGSVRASRDDAVITGDALEAILAPNPGDEDPDTDPNTDPVVTEATVSGNARYVRSDGISAEGDTLRTKPLERATEIVGSPARVGSGDATITANTILLDEDAGRLTVPTAGTFEQIRGPDSTARITWTGGMRYHAPTGRLEAERDVNAAVTSGIRPESGEAAPLATDTIRAERLSATVTPTTSDADDAEVEFLDLRAEGTDTPASMEALRRPTAGARADRVLFLEGPVILADNLAATLDVQGPGRLVVADLRAPRGDDDAGASRGAALFDWTGGLSFDRARGELVLRRTVSMIRKLPRVGLAPEDPDEETELRAERLTAVLTPAPDGARLIDDAAGLEFQRVLAEGAVWARRGAQQVIGDQLFYDTLAETARVESPSSGFVTVFDTNQNADATARAIAWDLARSRIDLVDPQPLLAPR